VERWTAKLREWIEIPSVTGSEPDYADALARELEALGLDVERQCVEGARFNVLARADTPEIVFCTHLDTVPPWFGSSEDGEFVHGRGACDAKGPAAAMLAAAQALLAEGERRIGLLFTVGEETDSAGAQRANERLAEPWRPRYTLIGEPTGNRFVAAHKGVYKARLVARGVAGHSSQAIGPSAVHELVRCLSCLLSRSWGSHPVLGHGTLNVGEIHGGVAANVVADRAEASLLLRAVEPPEASERRIRECLDEHVQVESIFKSYGPTEFHVPEGEEAIPVAFGTDAPHLGRWGQPVLYGPGQILDAHTDHERVSKRSLEEAARRYAGLARELLATSSVGGVR
jgi:acetylornithine deacetylase